MCQGRKSNKSYDVLTISYENCLVRSGFWLIPISVLPEIIWCTQSFRTKYKPPLSRKCPLFYTDVYGITVSRMNSVRLCAPKLYNCTSLVLRGIPRDRFLLFWDLSTRQSTIWTTAKEAQKNKKGKYKVHKIRPFLIIFVKFVPWAFPYSLYTPRYKMWMVRIRVLRDII